MVYELRRPGWPAGVQDLIDRLIGQTRTLAKLTRSQPNNATAISPEWINQPLQTARTGRAIRSALNLPQLTYR